MNNGQKRLSTASQQFLVLSVCFLQFRNKQFHVSLAFTHFCCEFLYKNEHDDKHWYK